MLRVTNGLYEVSNIGNIRRIGKKDYRKFNINRDGYVLVNLYKNGISKNLLVHRIVAKVFIPNYNNLPQINHKDGNKKNNKAENLEWCSAKENILHTYKELNRKGVSPNKGKFGKENSNAKITLQYDMNGNLIKKWGSKIEASKLLNIDATSISQCCTGKRKQAGGYIWRYV